MDQGINSSRTPSINPTSGGFSLAQIVKSIKFKRFHFLFIYKMYKIMSFVPFKYLVHSTYVTYNDGLPSSISLFAKACKGFE